MQPRKLRKALVIDWETTGLRSTQRPTTTYVEGPQGIELGAVVLDLESLSEHGSFTSRVRFMGRYNNVVYGPYNGLTWNDQAYRVHGIDLEALAIAPTPNFVAENFAAFVRLHFGNEPVLIAAHNPSGDLYHTYQLLFMGGVEGIRIHHRTLDSFTLGFAAFGAESSDELFSITSNVQREKHSSLEDARLCAEAIRAAIQRLRYAGFGTANSICLANEMI